MAHPYGSDRERRMPGARSLMGSATAFACTASALPLALIPGPGGSGRIAILSIGLSMRGGSSNGFALRNGTNGTELIHVSVPGNASSVRNPKESLFLSANATLEVQSDAPPGSTNWTTIDVEYVIDGGG